MFVEAARLLFLSCGCEDPRYPRLPKLKEILEKQTIFTASGSAPRRTRMEGVVPVLAEMLPKRF
jgi:hypothetical protein